MNFVPVHLARVPSSLSAGLMLRSIQSSQSQLLRAQIELATGRALHRPSDDAVAARSIASLDDVISQRLRRLGNLGHADGVLSALDGGIGELSDLLAEATALGLGHVDSGSGSGSMDADASAVNAMLQTVLDLANRQHAGLHIFGGTSTGRSPMVELLGGYQYRGVGAGLVTDLGLGSDIPLTMSGDDVFGSLSSRVQGDHDLDPRVLRDSRLIDLNGVRGLGIALGRVSIDLDPPGTSVIVDAGSAYTVSDLLDLLNEAVPGAFNINANGITVSPDNDVTLTISDLDGGSMAADLGLSGSFTGPGPVLAGDLDPRITSHTSVLSLGLDLGSIRIQQGEQTVDLDVSEVETVGELQQRFADLNLGIRLVISEEGDRFDLLNEISGSSVSIGEVDGGSTATDLGIRSMMRSTALSTFNAGAGVEFADALNDLRIELHDFTTFEVDLSGCTTVGDVLDAINAAAVVAYGDPPPLQAGLAADGNGITLTDTSGGDGRLIISAINGSFAAEQLGLVGETELATFVGEDRARVRVESVLTHLIDLRDALLAEDQAAIADAVARLELDRERAVSARTDAGHRVRLITAAMDRFETRQIADESLRAALRDVDYTDASMRFAALQQQLQASLAVTARISTLSLLEYL
jgi:flagellin-like hook-associated protein FlgL